MRTYKSMLVILFLLILALPAQALQKLTVILDWFPNPDHAPLFVAQQQGFFRQQGLSVDLVGPANPADPAKLVAAGKADVAITYQPQLLLAVQQGLPLVRIGTLINAPLGCLAVSAASNVRTLADLKGKTIGYSSAGVDAAMLNAMLQSVHLSTKDVILMNVNYDLTQALMTQHVAAVTGVQRNFEIIEMQLAGFPVRTFYPEQHGVPSYDEFIFVTNRHELQDPRLPRFLKALQQGESYLQQHPQQSWQIFAKNHPELNNELNRRAWFYTLPYFTRDPAALDAKRYVRFAVFMQQQGLLQKNLPLSSYATVLPVS